MQIKKYGIIIICFFFIFCFIGNINLQAQNPDEDFGDKVADMMLHDDFRELYYNVNSGMTTPDDIRFLKYLEAYYRDTLVINRTFADESGENRLEIIVYDNCNDTLEIGEGFRVDGIINCVTACISNENHSDSLRYYNPDVLMSLLYLKEKNIVTRNIGKRVAIFAPMLYCGNADDEMWISYILAYDGKIYLKHIHTQSPHDFGDYRLDENLEEKLKDLPEDLKKTFTHLLENTNFDALWED